MQSRTGIKKEWEWNWIRVLIASLSHHRNRSATGGLPAQHEETLEILGIARKAGEGCERLVVGRDDHIIGQRDRIEPVLFYIAVRIVERRAVVGIEPREDEILQDLIHVRSFKYRRFHRAAIGAGISGKINENIFAGTFRFRKRGGIGGYPLRLKNFGRWRTGG